MKNHHTPDAASEEYKPLVYVAHLGDFVSMLACTEPGVGFLYDLDKDYDQYIKISKYDIEKIMLNAQSELNKTLEALGGIA